VEIPGAGSAKRDATIFVCGTAIAKELSAYGTSRGIDDVYEPTQEIHAFDYLTKSSKDPSGLIPGHASFASSQFSLSLTIAG
jgi:hypothetical protein